MCWHFVKYHFHLKLLLNMLGCNLVRLGPLDLISVRALLLSLYILYISIQILLSNNFYIKYVSLPQRHADSDSIIHILMSLYVKYLYNFILYVHLICFTYLQSKFPN